MPLLYIIIINYKGISDTLACIESLLKISYSNYKIVVVDNNSEDESVEMLNKMYQGIDIIHVIESKENFGFSGGNNLGIKYALENNCKYVLLLNNDTVVEQNFLDSIINVMEQDSEAGIYTGKINYYSNKNKIWFGGGKFIWWKGNSEHIGCNEKDDGSFDLTQKITFATGCYMLMKASVIKKVGLMPEKYFLYYEDTEYSNRFIRQGYNIVYYPQSIIYHKVSASTGIQSDLSQYYINRNRLIYIRDNILGMKKVVAYVFYTFSTLKNIFNKKYRFQIVKRSWLDFMKGLEGRTY